VNAGSSIWYVFWLHGLSYPSTRQVRLQAARQYLKFVNRHDRAELFSGDEHGLGVQAFRNQLQGIQPGVSLGFPVLVPLTRYTGTPHHLALLEAERQSLLFDLL